MIFDVRTSSISQTSLLRVAVSAVQLATPSSRYSFILSSSCPSYDYIVLQFDIEVIIEGEHSVRTLPSVFPATIIFPGVTTSL